MATSKLEHFRQLLLTHKKAAASQKPRVFLPQSSLDQILQEIDIRETLYDPSFRIRAHKLESTFDFVSKYGRKIFAILVELGLERSLTIFIEHWMHDAALPISKQQLEPILESYSGRFFQCQWDYLAHKLSKEVYDRKLSAECILPYVGQIEVGGGGFSTVYDVLVHPAHQDIDLNVKETVWYQVLRP
jgi:hypothetical protein